MPVIFDSNGNVEKQWKVCTHIIKVPYGFSKGKMLNTEVDLNKWQYNDFNFCPKCGEKLND
jgi:hypothetical protein